MAEKIICKAAVFDPQWKVLFILRSLIVEVLTHPVIYHVSSQGARLCSYILFCVPGSSQNSINGHIILKR